MKSPTSEQFAIYCGVDGVLIPFVELGNGAFSHPCPLKGINERESYSPDMLAGLKEIKEGLILVTPRKRADLYGIFQAERWLRGVPRLEVENNSGETFHINNRLNAIARDQKIRPRPFVWVDEGLTDEVQLRAGLELTAPHIFLETSPRVGIEDFTLEAIKEFRRQYAGQRTT